MSQQTVYNTNSISVVNSDKQERSRIVHSSFTSIDCLLTQILRIDEEEFYLQNLSSDKPLPRLLASCKSI